MGTRRIAASYVYTLESEAPIRNGYIEYDENDGTIIEVGACEDPSAEEFYEGALVPGFVNAHSHIELSYLCGAIAEGGGYAAFAGSIAKVRDTFSEQEQLLAIDKADRVMWQEGVDAVGDIVNGSTSFATKASSHIYYKNFAEVFGLRECNLERQRKLLQYPNTSLSPHSIYSVQDAPFREVCGADCDEPLSIHFLETDDESMLYQGAGSLHEWYGKVGFECDFLHYGSPVERIVSCVPKDRRVLLVHNCAITEQDVELLVSHFSEPLSFVMCPRSNAYISGVEPRSVELLRARGVNICIGTDSLSSNWSLSMIEELKQFKNIPLAELLQWATINGAKALGIDDKYGSIDVGKQSGVVNITGVDLTNFTLTPESKSKRIL